MAYKALYRKWRPDVFDNVIGQEHITKTLKNEILENRIAHAYLFTGTRGTGKTSTAKILSRAINCQNSENGNPCNKCDICTGIINETIMDIIEIDAASNTGVDNIRSIIEQVQYTPTVAKYKVYIIDEVHMLSQGAFNALLKTLEEPPNHVVFILATTEVHKIPATILSRCQRFDFKTISVNDISSRIKNILNGEGISANDDAIDYVAYLANGSMRDSLSILDQCLAFKKDNLTYDDVINILGTLDDLTLYKIAEFIAKSDTKGAIEEFFSLVDSGKNIDDFAASLLDAFTKIMISNVSGGKINHSVNKTRNELVFDIAKMFSHEKIMFCIEILNDLVVNLKFSKNANVLIEAAIIKMCETDLCDTRGALLQRIKQLEDKVASLISGGAVVQLENAKNMPNDLSDKPSQSDLSFKASQVDLPWEDNSEAEILSAEKEISALNTSSKEENQYKKTITETINENPEPMSEEENTEKSFEPSSVNNGDVISKIASGWSEIINR